MDDSIVKAIEFLHQTFLLAPSDYCEHNLCHVRDCFHIRKLVITGKHPESGQNPTKDELDQIIADADIDGDGQIDFEEFVVMMNRQEARDLAGFILFSKILS